MNITSTAVITTQMVDAAISRSLFLGTDLHPFLELLSRPVVDDVCDRGRPDEAVARLVARARGVDDRVDDECGDPVFDDEDQHRLRQKARLEHAPAVLVRDSALAAVTDRLDHRHPYVARGLFDSVDDRLHSVSNHHRLDFHHAAPPPLLKTTLGTKKEAPGAPERCSR